MLTDFTLKEKNSALYICNIHIFTNRYIKVKTHKPLVLFETCYFLYSNNII